MTDNLGRLIAEGKTKKIYMDPLDGSVVNILSKDDITAGDGKKHDVVPNKGELSTRTTCNVFRVLKSREIPVAFHEKTGPTSFKADRCNMIALEVVVRRIALGSYLKRHPHVEKGTVFDTPLVEFFLKTSGKQWLGEDIPVDDPLVRFPNAPFRKGFLYRPDVPFVYGNNFMVVQPEVIFFGNRGIVPASGSWRQLLFQMDDIASNVFLVLESQWKQQDCILADMKIECGLNLDGHLVLADVIDNDSWRVLRQGEHLDKQNYRDGKDLDLVSKNYREVADMTDWFV